MTSTVVLTWPYTAKTKIDVLNQNKRTVAKGINNFLLLSEKVERT